MFTNLDYDCGLFWAQIQTVENRKRNKAMENLEQMKKGAVLVFDRQVLMHQTSEDQALAQEVLGLFFKHLNRLESSDWQELQLPFEMHTLRGAAASVGAVQIEDLSGHWRTLGERLETQLRQAAKAFRAAAETF
ncbi:Hpt domain-containing protein [Aestuariivirga litoralis]|uniref:Hpt domain-containing protein n=1 Tax=Aestuariivirga litoralis TaxID=2650924 RepID=UPI001AEE73E7|nr:Hpt domain-containing protein [Aestuariivirga litoralis]MBG1233023.1 Hpt domain-containing protein [Aestuariivirga litoralis]